MTTAHLNGYPIECSDLIVHHYQAIEGMEEGDLISEVRERRRDTVLRSWSSLP